MSTTDEHAKPSAPVDAQPADAQPSDALSADAPPSDAQPSDAPPADYLLADLPDAVRLRVLAWAAEALGAADPTAVPPALSRVARFAPAKRAKLAATALAQAVQTDNAFRAMVAEHVAQLPHLGASHQGDPTAAAARAFLLRLPEQHELLVAVATATERAATRSRIGELERVVRELTVKLAQTNAQLQAESQAQADPGQEADRLRLRLREQGNRLRELQQLREGEAASATQVVAAATAQRDQARADVDLWRQRAEAAEARASAAAQSVQRLRESAGDRRATSDRRLELLLGALEGAASGLRREWDLVGGGPAPADVIAARLPRGPLDAERTSDPTRLTAWFGIPGAHVIVDGYNVTKTGFAEMVLSDQRDRLVRSLAALAARTSAEVTVVFDGAAVSSHRPLGRGVRVLFSPPGVLADDVIRDLVRAEPIGRAVIVISSDREVVDRATADGARTAPSAVLLAAFGG